MESNQFLPSSVDESEDSQAARTRKSGAEGESRAAAGVLVEASASSASDQAERKLRLAAALLDGTPWPTLAVDEESVILHANGAARALLKKEEGLRVSRGMLGATQREQAGELKELIRVTATSGKNTMFAIPRPPKARPLFVRMVPLAVATDQEPGGPQCVAVFVTDPDSQPLAGSTCLRVLYGLSEAEARLTQVLLQEGRSLRDAAERCGVTLNTAKTQLKRVFDKTGTRRRSDLVSLVLRSVGPG
jgi:DNA-binding CsgD family transcriptional regulator